MRKKPRSNTRRSVRIAIAGGIVAFVVSMATMLVAVVTAMQQG